MRALCYEGTGKLAVRNMPDPAIQRPHDAVVQVRLSSACGSDLHILDGYMPTAHRGHVLGHEFIGTVVAIGDEVNRWPELIAEEGAHLHLYGKGEARPGRKMGHVTRVKRS